MKVIAWIETVCGFFYWMLLEMSKTYTQLSSIINVITSALLLLNGIALIILCDHTSKIEDKKKLKNKDNQPGK